MSRGFVFKLGEWEAMKRRNEETRKRRQGETGEPRKNQFELGSFVLYPMGLRGGLFSCLLKGNAPPRCFFDGIAFCDTIDFYLIFCQLKHEMFRKFVGISFNLFS